MKLIPNKVYTAPQKEKQKGTGTIKRPRRWIIKLYIMVVSQAVHSLPGSNYILGPAALSKAGQTHMGACSFLQLGQI